MKIELNITESEVKSLREEIPTMIRSAIGKRSNPSRWGKQQPKSHWRNIESVLGKIESRLPVILPAEGDGV